MCITVHLALYCTTGSRQNSQQADWHNQYDGETNSRSTNVLLRRMIWLRSNRGLLRFCCKDDKKTFESVAVRSVVSKVDKILTVCSDFNRNLLHVSLDISLSSLVAGFTPRLSPVISETFHVSCRH